MNNKGFLRRILPFLATFAVSVFIASFFVNIGPSRDWSSRRGRCRHEVERLRFENDQLREENQQLKAGRNNWEFRHDPPDFDENWQPGPDVPVLDPAHVPAPPPPPKSRR